MLREKLARSNGKKGYFQAIAGLAGLVVILFLLNAIISYPPDSSMPLAEEKRENLNTSVSASETPKQMTSSGEFLESIANNIISGGPPKDGISPIDKPRYISIAEANGFLEEDDRVFIVDYGGTIKIFPQKILVWHEIVNDEINGEKVSFTYCPLTGSVIGFKGKVDGIETTFGTSGKLVNSNLVMYDRFSESYWPQVLGIAVEGTQKGKRLQQIPMTWARWTKARQEFPKAQVLSTNTGFIRSYDIDPYGAYKEKGNYYDSGGAFFPIIREDSRLPAKEVVLGVAEGKGIAIAKHTIAKQKIVNAENVVALWDESLETARAYSRQLDEKTLTFEWKEGKIIDQETQSQWSVAGEAISGPLKGTRLKWMDSFDVFWFAWAAFYPQTKLIN